MKRAATALSSYAIAVAIAISILSYAGMAQIQVLERQIAGSIDNDVATLADATTKRMAAVSSIMEVTAELPQVEDTSYAHLVSTQYKGVPEDAAVEKREIARDILARNPDINALGFILTDGRMYLEEPYGRQLNLTRTNFGDRDYYLGAIAAGKAYLGEVYISSATGASAAGLTVPVYSNNGTLAGAWTAFMDLRGLYGHIDEVLGPDKDRIVYYIDQGGYEAVYSDRLIPAASEPLANLSSYKDAVAGERGSKIETMGGVKMYVAYGPVEMPSTTWTLILMQPYDEAFAPAGEARSQLTLAIVAAAVVAGALAYPVYQSTGGKNTK